MTSYSDLVRRLVSVDNDQLPYDYEQGLCAWCRTGTDAEHPERYNSLHPEKFTATLHALDCPYAEATAILARLKPHEFKGRSDRDCEVCRWPDRSAAHFRDIPAHPVPPAAKPSGSLVGTVIDGWKCVQDLPYQGFDSPQRFWCRVLTFADAEGYTATVYGTDVGYNLPDYFLDRRDVLQLAQEKLAPPVPDEVHPEFQFSEEGADWLDLNMPEEPEHTGWSGEPHPGRHF